VGTAECSNAADSEIGRSVLTKLDRLLAFDGQSFDCGGIDGASVMVEGIKQGRRFAFVANNPWYCEDEASVLVANILTDLEQAALRPNNRLQRAGEE
jgi:hypothetical protein